MPNELWNVIGALLIATAMLATHPLKPAVAERLETQFAMNWGQVQQMEDACPADVPCLVPFQVQ